MYFILINNKIFNFFFFLGQNIQLIYLSLFLVLNLFNSNTIVDSLPKTLSFWARNGFSYTIRNL